MGTLYLVYLEDKASFLVHAYDVEGEDTHDEINSQVERIEDSLAEILSAKVSFNEGENFAINTAELTNLLQEAQEKEYVTKKDLRKTISLFRQLASYLNSKADNLERCLNSSK